MNRIFYKYSNMPVQMKAVFWLTICTLLQKGISIITVPIFTRIMSTNDYGIFNEFISWENIIQLFTTLSLHTGIFNTAMIKNEDRHSVVVSSYLGLTSITTIVVFVIYFPFREYISSAMGLEEKVVYFMFLNLFLAPALNLWMAQQRYEYKYVRLVVYTVIYSTINPLISYFVVVHAENMAYGRIASTSIVSSIFYGIIYIAIFLKGRIFFDRDLWKNALIVNIPLIPHFLAGSVLNQSDRLMIGNIVGDSEAGIYSVGYSAAMMLQLVVSSVNASIVPWMYKKMKEGYPEKAKGMLNISCILMFGAVILFMLFAPECMWILAPSSYHDAVWIFPPLTASVFFIYVYGLFCNIELYYEKSIYITISSCFAAGLNIVLNYLLIPKMGYEIAGYTTLVSYMVYAGTHFVFAKRVVSEKKIKAPIDSRFILLLSVFLLILTIIINELYKSTFLRYIVALFIILFVIIFRNRIIKFFKEVKNR